MYNRIKKTVKALFPKSFLYKHELAFRYLYYQFYRGRKFKCNICNNGLRKFMRPEDGERICPFCGSLARSRRLWDLLQSDYLRENLKILDFSPSRSLYRKLKREENFSYTATDYSGEFLADKQHDITDLELPDDGFDLIICYHILEHVEEDLKAMQELYRVLKTSGVCIIQTPFKEGEIFEDPSIRTPEERQKHYGQADHVRIYSVDGLAKRLSMAGFQVEVKAFTEKPGNKNGFKEQEYVLVVQKVITGNGG